jgi:[ribosomal protein S5]-alanine N-acetyltransferase
MINSAVFAKPLPTERLELVPALLAHADATIAGSEAVASLLQVLVPPSWPPELLDPGALEFFRDKLRADESQAAWWFYFVLLRGANSPSTLIGSAGFKGPPDADGMVEIGYGVLPEFQMNGFASEASQALVAFAFRDARVVRVIAETLPELIGSMGVMRRCGMKQLDEAPNEPGGVRFGVTRAEYDALA